MGFFDFLKKKPQEQPVVEQTEEKDVVEIAGIEVNTTPEKEEDIVLNVNENLGTTTAINQAVHEVMDVASHPPVVLFEGYRQRCTGAPEGIAAVLRTCEAVSAVYRQGAYEQVRRDLRIEIREEENRTDDAVAFLERDVRER